MYVWRIHMGMGREASLADETHRDTACRDPDLSFSSSPP